MPLQKLLLCLCVCLLSAPLLARDLVLAFDNTLRPSTSLDAMARSQMLVRNLANAGVPQAMFLVNTRGLDTKALQRLSLYSNQGQLLVNTGHGHGLVAKSDLYVYEIGILKAHRLLRRYSGYRGHVFFPYLHEFGDSHLQAGLKQFLQERGFKPAYTSNTPWRGADLYLDQLYQQRISSNRRVDIVALEKFYVALATRMLEEQSRLPTLLLGYTPPQVLVLQETDLAAYFAAALVEHLQARGWRVIATERAFADPVANPLQHLGFGANHYWPAVTGMPDTRTAYPRVLGSRKAELDQWLQAQMPELLQ